MRILLIIAMLAACGPMTPEDRGIEVDHAMSSLGVFNQSKAMLDLEGMAEDHYLAQLDNLFQDTQVWWTTTLCPGTGSPAVIYKDKCNYGRMWNCQELYVAAPLNEKTCGSALLHEYAHCLRMALFEGDGDADHTSDIWELVADAHDRACTREGGLGVAAIDQAEANRKHIAECELGQ
jgi:hypothetical protein